MFLPVYISYVLVLSCFSIANLFQFRVMMNSSPLFCSGLELGKLAVSSGLLRLSWSKISELHGSIDPDQDSNLRFQIYPEAKYAVVALVAPPICTRRNLFREDGSVNSELTLLDGSSGSDAFRFLFSENISSFSVHSPAYQLFASVYDRLVDLKSQLFSSEKPLIVTGSELGGSVASLFTLWLLNNIERGRKRPLCITFGSTLIGDASLQQLLENSIWNSCFLHVASTQDLFPKLLIPSDYSPTLADDSKAVTFKPFGTFLVSCESGCVCIEVPNAVLELLAGINGGLALDNRTSIYDEILHRLERPIYGKMLQCLERSLVLTRVDLSGESVSDWLLAGMFLQPDHIGIGRSQEASMIRDVIMKMEERAKRKLQFDPFKELIEMKINMVHLEWYKKSCRSKGIGYYDHFKSQISQGMSSVQKFKKSLTDYWKYMVESAEKKPQSERVAFRKRFLYAGNNYRKMIEPLDIAEHYCNNNSRDYITTCRSRHYVMLERWFNEVEKCEIVSAKRDLTDLLTLDSCFWARVEEAMKSIGLLRKSEIIDGEKESLTQKLHGFEEYVWEMIGKRMVSPEIFLEDSSFMRWWREYRKFKGDDYKSPFTDFMNMGRYKSYGTVSTSG